MNDLPKIINQYAKLVLFSDGTGVIVTNPSPKDFKINTNKVLLDINAVFKTKFLALNLKKKYHYLLFWD